eukprot:GHUV01036827.1.p1 GENE.GHUV01036827.1~~GHUV01036827.1.p1  ORF type:complete len:141 (+),score=29.73 GHUV01036827.1:127-549(+)
MPQAMVELLDPTGAYFHGRVIAQGVPAGPEDGVTDVAAFKRLMQGLEGREPVLLIVDDSSAVWPNDKRNLFVVERYIYFPSSRRRFGMQGRSLLEIDRCVLNSDYSDWQSSTLTLTVCACYRGSVWQLSARVGVHRCFVW